MTFSSHNNFTLVFSFFKFNWITADLSYTDSQWLDFKSANRLNVKVVYKVNKYLLKYFGKAASAIQLMVVTQKSNP